MRQARWRLVVVARFAVQFRVQIDAQDRAQHRQANSDLGLDGFEFPRGA
ncbi:MAG: hypothetical protein ACI8PT_004492 [Gammaproteobacteria bacterium]|jgi:hypothetical protein